MITGYDARKSVYLEAFQKNGMEFQLAVAIEELSELQKEICKNLRGYENREHLAEEFADVHVIMEQLGLVFHITEQETQQRMNDKVSRLEKSLRKRI